MGNLPFYIVDVFAEKKYAVNQAPFKPEEKRLELLETESSGLSVR